MTDITVNIKIDDSGASKNLQRIIRMTEMLDRNFQTIKTHLRRTSIMVLQFQQRAARMAEPFTKVSGTIKRFQESINKLTSALSKSQVSSKSFSNNIAKLGNTKIDAKLNNIAKNANKIAESFRKVNVEIDKFITKLSTVKEKLKNFKVNIGNVNVKTGGGIGVGGFTQGAGAGAGAGLAMLALHGTKAGGVLGGLSRIMTSTAGAATIAAGAFGVVAYKIGEMVTAAGNVASEYISFRNAILSVSGSMENANLNLAYAVDVADRFKTSLQDTVRGYSKFSVSAKLAGVSAQGVNTAFESLTKTIRVLNLNKEKTKTFFLAFEQMLSKGTVSTEELRRQLGEVLPGAFELGAFAAGYAADEIGQFSKALSQGLIKSADFVPKFAKVLDDQFGYLLPEALKKSQAAVQGLQNKIEILIANIGTWAQPYLTKFYNWAERRADEINKKLFGTEGLSLSESGYSDQYDQLKLESKAYVESLDEMMKLIKDFNGQEAVDFRTKVIGFKDANKRLLSTKKGIEDLQRELFEAEEIVDSASIWDNFLVGIGAADISDVAERLEHAKNKIPGLKIAIEQLIPSLHELFRENRGLRSALDGLIPGLGDYVEKAKKVKEANEEWAKNLPIKELQQEYRSLFMNEKAREKYLLQMERENKLKEDNLTGKAAKDYNDMTQSLLSLTGAIYDANEALDEQNEKIQDNVSDLKKSATAFEKLYDEFDEMSKKPKKDSGFSLGDMSGAIYELKRLMNIGSDFNDIEKQAERVKDIISDIRDGDSKTDSSIAKYESKHIRDLMKTYMDKANDEAKKEEIKLKAGLDMKYFNLKYGEAKRELEEKNNSDQITLRANVKIEENISDDLRTAMQDQTIRKTIVWIHEHVGSPVKSVGDVAPVPEGGGLEKELDKQTGP